MSYKPAGAPRDPITGLPRKPLAPLVAVLPPAHLCRVHALQDDDELDGPSLAERAALRMGFA